MSLSQLARSIAPSPTLALNEEARILKEKGEAVIHLGAGEPKNKAPIAAVLSSAAKLTASDLKYTPTEGTVSLRKAIIRYTEENYDRVPTPENVIVTAGAKQAIFNVLFTLLNPQDEVIVLAPYWVSYPEIVKMVYGVPVIVTPESGGFYPRMEEVKKNVTSYTKAIIVNSPNNPSGVVYSEDFVGELAEFCESKGIYYISDDIYHKLVFDGRKWANPYKFSKQDLETTHVISINGVSKLYGMTGVRIGWVVAPRKITEIMINVQGQTTTTASLVQQAAAEGALTGVQSVIESLRSMLQNNCQVMLQELKGMSSLHVSPPDGTYYCLPDFRAYGAPFGGESVKMCKFLLDKARVVTVPGKEFGMEGHLRLSYCGTIKEIKEGVERIKWAMDPSSPNEIFIGERKVVRDWL